MANQNKTEMKTIFKGLDGQLWLNDEIEIGSIQECVLNQSNEFEEVPLAGNTVSQWKLKGVSLSGKIERLKIDYTFVDIMAQYKDGTQPDISIIGKVYNESTGKVQRTKVTGVCLEGMDIFNIKPGELTKEDISYKAGDYTHLEKY
jgi:hypothetical protein